MAGITRYRWGWWSNRCQWYWRLWRWHVITNAWMRSGMLVTKWIWCNNTCSVINFISIFDICIPIWLTLEIVGGYSTYCMVFKSNCHFIIKPFVDFNYIAVDSCYGVWCLINSMVLINFNALSDLVGGYRWRWVATNVVLQFDFE